MSTDTKTTNDEGQKTKPSRSGLLFAVGMIAALILLIALNMN
jgi:hypothetical protein